MHPSARPPHPKQKHQKHMENSGFSFVVFFENILITKRTTQNSLLSAYIHHAKKVLRKEIRKKFNFVIQQRDGNAVLKWQRRESENNGHCVLDNENN